MKKILYVVSIAALIALDSYSKDYGEDIHGGVSRLSLEGEHKPIFNLGYGITKSLDNKVILGVSFDGEYASLAEGSLVGAGTDLKVGYNVWDKMNAYGLVGAKFQSIDSNSGYGLGYGFGVDYPITRTISAAVEYKSYNMNASNTQDYDSKTVGLNLKYGF